MVSQREKCEAFATLHASDGAFVIPNPYDVGSARVLEHLGFVALATTSAGVAQTLGKLDGQVTLEEKLAHCRLVASATSVPVNVDFEDGFARAPLDVAEHVRLVAETGVAGCSIEDYDRERKEIIGFDEAVDRVSAAAQAVAALDVPFQLTARAENLLRGVHDLTDTIKRLQAYAEAGAHVLYPPGVSSLDDLASVTAAVDRPVNVLSVFFHDTTVSEFAAAGARRISVGSALANLSMAPVIAAGREMLEQGTFSWTAGMPRDLRELLKG